MLFDKLQGILPDSVRGTYRVLLNYGTVEVFLSSWDKQKLYLGERCSTVMCGCGGEEIGSVNRRHDSKIRMRFQIIIGKIKNGSRASLVVQ